MAAMANPSPKDTPQSAWAQRLMAAHINAVENLVVFAPLVLTTRALGIATATTAFACAALFLGKACPRRDLHAGDSGLAHAVLRGRFCRASTIGARDLQADLRFRCGQPNPPKRVFTETAQPARARWSPADRA